MRKIYGGAISGVKLIMMIISLYFDFAFSNTLQ